MYNETIKLVAETKTVDEYGDTIIVETEKRVFARLMSVGQSEFYQAQALGLKPEIKFVLADYLDYNDEKVIKYKAFNQDEEEVYTVIRTYRKDNTLEIVCKRGVDE